jgi:hypothetical protein
MNPLDRKSTWIFLAVCYLWIAIFPSSGIATAEDCYVQRFSYSTSVNCGEGRSYLRTEDNTRDRRGRKDDMPSKRRYDTEYFDRHRCSQTGILTRD